MSTCSWRNALKKTAKTAIRKKAPPAELGELRARLTEAEDALRAIREGDVDAIVVSGEHGERLFTLAETENVYRLMIETMNEAGMAVTPEGIILFANNRLGQMLQASDADLLGQPIWRYVPETDRPRLARLIEEIRQAPASTHLTLRTTGGENIPVYVWASFLNHAAGPTICLVGTDLTQIEASQELINHLREQQNALQESEGRLRLATESANVGLWFQDIASGQITFTAQTKAILGLPGDAPATIERVQALTHPDDRELLRKWNSRVGGTQELEHRIVRPDGALRWILWKGRTEMDVQGRPWRNMGILMDITEQKRAEQEIRQLNASLEERVKERTTALIAANKEMEEFTYSVAHDLRSPLRHITAFSSLLRKGLDANLTPGNQDYLQMIERAAVRMGKLVDGLLEYARTGRTDLHKARTNLAHLLAEATSALAPNLARRVVEWRIEPLPDAVVDSDMLRQVFVNILHNALKFTRERERAVIEVGATTDSREHVVFVRDNGIGFDQAHAQRLFDPFQQLHRREESGGVGMGLAIVRRIIERHGGRVWAEGKPGEGTVVYFSLPRQ